MPFGSKGYNAKQNINQSKQIWSHTCVEFKKQNKRTKEKKKRGQTLHYREQMVTRGEVGRQVGEIGEGDKEHNYLDEHWVIDGSVESPYCSLGINITLYVNYTRI